MIYRWFKTLSLSSKCFIAVTIAALLSMCYFHTSIDTSQVRSSLRQLINSELEPENSHFSLCRYNVSARGNRINTVKCAMTARQAGRLGNLMGEYATLYSLSRLNQRPALMSPGMAKVLRRYFKVTMASLSEDLYNSIKWTDVTVYNKLDSHYDNLHGLYIQLTGYPVAHFFYQDFKEEIKREFTLKDQIREKAQNKLRKYVANRTSVTFVGVHVRRGDYVNIIENRRHGVMADERYMERATDYFRSRYSDVLFFVVSNDMKWCLANVPNPRGDVIFVGNDDESRPIDDLAILINCNHTIFTIGTFGYFGAYLAGGETVYYSNYITQSQIQDGIKPEEWHPIAADVENNYIH